MMNISKLIFVLVWKSIIPSHSDCSNLYGRRCPYVPAPSGKTPSCARPGFTFCENPDGYPGELIMFLASQARYNHRSLVTDETKEEFPATKGPYPPSKYPTSYEGIHLTTSVPTTNLEEIAWQNHGLQPPPQPANYSGNFLDGFNGYQDASISQSGGQFLRYKYTSNIPQQRFREVSSKIFGYPAYTNFLWKRDLNAMFKPMHERVKRGELFRRQLREIRESLFKKNFTGEIKYKRSKRQSDFDSGNLCQTRASFIMPRAAINKEGDWMYIVNMENNNQKYTQLVRSEVCASQTCSSLCGLPIGYTSKCEQKYIQKRLVALKGEGDQLYTDVFWIPSCCVCTITRN